MNINLCKVDPNDFFLKEKIFTFYKHNDFSLYEHLLRSKKG